MVVQSNAALKPLWSRRELNKTGMRVRGLGRLGAGEPRGYGSRCLLGDCRAVVHTLRQARPAQRARLLPTTWCVSWGDASRQGLAPRRVSARVVLAEAAPR